MNQIAAGPNGSGIPLGTQKYAQRVYYSCFLGRHLIEWLQKRDANTQLDTALSIGQVLVDLGYLNDLSAPSASSSSLCLQPDFASKAKFGETKPYRPNVMADSLEEVLNPSTSFTPQQPLIRKISMVAERSPLLPSPKGTDLYNFMLTHSVQLK